MCDVLTQLSAMNNQDLTMLLPQFGRRSAGGHAPHLRLLCGLFLF
jgi:hypothetical protein